MRKYILCFLCCAAILLLGGAPSRAADVGADGYFENTRTVLLLPARYEDRDGEYAANRMDREMRQIFRYPYYRLVKADAYEGRAYDKGSFLKTAEESGADIVVQPVVEVWDQFTFYPVQLFRDADPVVQTRAELHILSWKRSEGKVRDDETFYFRAEERGTLTDPPEIMNTMMKSLLKKFPYQRVPKDVAANLSGDNEIQMNPATAHLKA